MSDFLMSDLRGSFESTRLGVGKDNSLSRTALNWEALKGRNTKA